MAETREFPTEVLVSLTSGILLCDFSAMHECAEFLMGHPIWTHHFASKDLLRDIKGTILAQCPGLPMEVEGVTAENYRAYVAKLVAEFGEKQTIRKGDGLTAMLPTDGIPDHVTPIIIKAGKDDA
jgi:hypothetical protein